VTRKLEIHVGVGFAALATDVTNAWHRAERGEDVAEHHLSFESWEGLAKVLTGKRLELLRHLHRSPTPSIAALARALGRDYKRVYEDVEALAAAGLIERNEAGLTAGYGEIRAHIALR
jgi:predicted transcriptional regulator